MTISKYLFLATVFFASSSLYAACSNATDPLPDHSSALTVKLSTTEISQEQGRRSILSLGTIKNSSGTCFEDLVIEVKYFNSSHTLTDTVVQPIYGLVVPAQDEVAIRILDAAAKSKDAYATQEARVLSAEPRVSYQKEKRTKWSTLGELLLSWGPMLLLIAVWIFFMQRMRRKDSPQERSVSVLEKQLELSSTQVESFRRAVAALESIAASRRGS